MEMRSIFHRSGVLDWVLQRLSAVILAIYTISILLVLLANPQMDYVTWKALFKSSIMQGATVIALAALCAHAWIGMWTVTTDYMTPIQLGKLATPVRLAAQLMILLMILGYLGWGIYILWGI